MNPQAAIEAAKIAAETAARNTIITGIVAIVTIIITSIISIRTARKSNELAKDLGEKNLKALEQKRYIDAISAERVKWINDMRDRFSEYLKLAHIQMNDLDKLKFDILAKGETHPEVKKSALELRDRYFEIVYVSNYIFLLLNPKEPVTEKLIGLHEEITTALNIKNINAFKYGDCEQVVKDSSYFHQVILKAEWKRVKEENKKGEEIDDAATNDIYITIAKKLDEDVYNKYFS
ncbi:hypothetical protein [Bacillus paramycoides]|uniref:hypothetical protein n=1 Tax=Bacillus paramycoides TaxID=2026194 RepID=UPI002E234FD7|nr:hypothetical protein [Bacillus paramycoides]